MSGPEQNPDVEPDTRVAVEGVSGRVRRHLSELGRLSAPIVVSRSGFLLLVFADTAMTGQYSAEELAFLAIALALFMPMIITSLGLIMGTLVLTANANGAGRYRECGEIWRRSLVYAAIIGGFCILIGTQAQNILQLTGQTESISMGGGAVMEVITYGLPGQLLFLSSAYFLEGLGRPVPAMVVMVFANILNVGLNWLLIDGGAGLDAMGAAGAAWATTAARWFMAISLFAYVWFLHDREKFGVRERPTGGFRSWVELRRIGYAIGLSVGVESLAFATLNIFAGWLGEVPLASYGLTLNFMALVFMMAIGIGSATTVRVGIAYGRGDAPDAALAGWTGLGANTLMMAAASIFIWLAPQTVVGVYASDPALIAEALISLMFVGWIFIPDGGQAVMASALRGRKDVWAPSFIQLASFFGVMVPAGYLSAFVLENGTVGLFHGIMAGVVVSLVLLSARFHFLYRRDVSQGSLAD